MTVDEMVIADSSSGSESETPPIADENLIALMQKTGYTITQENGQRKYGGPPPDWGNRPPPRGAEVFVGKIPRDVFEDELVPVFETAGRIYELRLMMDFDGKNRGYAFVMYFSKGEAKGAVKKLNNYEIRKGRLLGVCYSVDNCRLFVGGIPKSKKKDDIFNEMIKVTEGVVDVIVYPSASDKTKNRGFAFVEYTSHRAAAMARRKLIPGRIQLWGHPIAVDWAEPEQEVDDDIMEQVKVLYVRNLMLDTTEDTLLSIFSQFQPGCVERVKKIRDYAFVHFTSRETCMHAMKKINGTDIDETEVEVTLAKPVDKNDYNRMAKVGAKVLNQTQDMSPTLVHSPPAINQNGMFVYQAGLYGTEVVYYPLAQSNVLPAVTVPALRNPATRNEKARSGMNGRLGNNRSNYLGYSAGKATFGRYYAKNNSDRSADANGMQSVDAAYDNTYNVADSALHPALITGNTIPAAPVIPMGQALPHYVTPLTQAVSQVIPTTIANPNKNADSVLEELCQTHLWGTPTYQLLTMFGSDARQFYIYKVTIPAFATVFQPPKLSENIEEAKCIAAEYVLSCLGFQPDGNPSAVPIATVVNPSSTSYQNMYTQPSQLHVGATAIATSAAAQVNPHPSTIPIPYVDTHSMVQPVAIMYQ